MFDALLDRLRTHPTEWLEARRREVIGAQRELPEELAIAACRRAAGSITSALTGVGAVLDRLWSAPTSTSRSDAVCFA